MLAAANAAMRRRFVGEPSVRFNGLGVRGVPEGRAGVAAHVAEGKSESGEESGL